MNQQDLNTWIEKLITNTQLNVEDLCGSTANVEVTITGKESTEDRFVGEMQSEQFLKIDVAFLKEEQRIVRTVYNGMMPTLNYLNNYSQDQIFEFEKEIQTYFNQIGTGLNHYWTIPIVEQDLPLYELMNLGEVVLPICRGIPCAYEKADALQIYRKESKPTWATRATLLSGYIAQHGMAIIKFVDKETESTTFAPLQKAKEYSTQLLDGFIRVGIIRKLI